MHSTTTASTTTEMEHMDGIAAHLNFADQDVKALQQAATRLAPHIGSIVDTVQKELGPHLAIDDADVKLGRESLRRYLGRIMTGPYDNRFYSYLKWVASSSDSKGNDIRHDPTYINAMLGTLEAALIRHITSLKLVSEAEILAAFSKLLWMQSYYFHKTGNTNKNVRWPTVAEFLWGVPVFLRGCPAFPVVVGALTGGLTVYFSFKKQALVA